jgi:hypothetical protein
LDFDGPGADGLHFREVRDLDHLGLMLALAKLGVVFILPLTPITLANTPTYPVSNVDSLDFNLDLLNSQNDLNGHLPKANYFFGSKRT